MKTIYLILITLIVPTSLLIGEEHNDSPCTFLIEKIKREGVYDYLVKWVDSLPGRNLHEHNYRLIEESNNPKYKVIELSESDLNWVRLSLDPLVCRIRISYRNDWELSYALIGNKKWAIIIYRNSCDIPNSPLYFYKDRRLALYCNWITDW